ncbi:MAG TPA: aminotransferase class IV, partial [Anaeromyxobacter sp.]
MPRRAELPARTVWIDGRLARGDAATLSLFDRGARDGEGLLETVRVHDGRPGDWERHMERLVLSAAELGFPVPAGPDTLRAALDAVLEANDLSDAVARLTVTRGVPGGRPTRTCAWVEAEPIAARLWSGARNGRASAILSKAAFEPGPLGRHKTTSRLAYSLAREEARAARADEALLVSAAGEVLEGAVSNVFAVIGGEIVTPPLARG